MILAERESCGISAAIVFPRQSEVRMRAMAEHSQPQLQALSPFWLSDLDFEA